MNEVDELCVLETNNPVKLEEEAYPVKLDKAESPLVGRGLLECAPLLLKDHVGVTNVCA